MEPIHTDRILIRPLKRGDLRALHSMYGDAELMQFITGRPRTPWETRARLMKDLGHHRDFGFGLCLAIWRESGEPVGRCGMEPQVTSGGLEGELAWMFRQPWWGMGLATEVGRALIERGRSRADLTRMFARAYAENTASLAVMEKLGMRSIGVVDGEVEYEVV